MRSWLESTGSGALYVAPASPWQNGYAESFHSKLRDEFLNREDFESQAHAQAMGTLWKGEYNTERPHSSLAYRTPAGESMSRPTVTAMGPHVGELLTPAQRRVLIALCRPFKDSTYATPATNQQIADELVVSVDAVKSTLRALFEVFGVDALPQNQKRASLALQAMRTGVITRRDL